MPVQSFEIQDIKGGELMVSYKVKRFPPTKEEGHGIHEISEDDLEIESVELVIGGKGIGVMKLLNEKQMKAICQGIEPEE